LGTHIWKIICSEWPQKADLLKHVQNRKAPEFSQKTEPTVLIHTVHQKTDKLSHKPDEEKDCAFSNNKGTVIKYIKREYGFIGLF
jgi:hypothetical protein